MRQGSVRRNEAQWFIRETRGGGSGSGLSEGQAATELAPRNYRHGYNRQQCIFYADAIVDSYGTGSLADTGVGSFWKEYTAQKGANGFNPSRTTKYISGRPRVTRIFGESVTALGEPLKVLNMKGRVYRFGTGQLVKR